MKYEDICIDFAYIQSWFDSWYHVVIPELGVAPKNP